MTYSIIGILAAIILIIINRDILWMPKGSTASRTQRLYRGFLIGVLGYYITDGIWGILDAWHLTSLQFADTTLYFIAMAAAVLLWTQYVIAYLESDNVFNTLLKYAGWAFFVFEIIVVIINIFSPVMFWFDESGAYHAASLRYVTFGVQILFFLMTSIYTLRLTARTEGKARLRNMTIGMFGIAMIALIVFQIYYPLWPFYAMGYMVGTCLLHSFVVEDEKEEYRRELEESLQREKAQKQELSESREALQNALEAAENANKAKTAFLSNMSHEIRTPMNAIIGLNSLAMRNESLPDETREYLKKIGESAHHLLGLINDILDMSRIESGRLTLKNEEFSFSELLKAVNTMFSSQCNDKGLDYQCHIQGEVDDYYIGDNMKLRQVLINILSNAVKFTPEGGKVSLIVKRMAQLNGLTTLCFRIADTGIGMSKEYLPHIFDTFSQEDSSTTSKYGSSGLGMAITKNFVEMMNGGIEVESEKGKGTVFTVTVTLMDSEGKDIDGEVDEIRPDEMTVLIVDDDPIACEHAKLVLEKTGISAEIAGSGPEAIEMVRLRHARMEPYNLILVDWKMPEMDGVETTRRIREIVGNKSAIIILTAYRWDDVLEEAIQAGVDSFIAKPLFATAVMEEFESAMKRKGIQATKEANKADLTGRRILLAEDVQVNAEIIMMVLQMRQMEADLAVNGKIAVEKFSEHEQGYYDAILMDMRMPEMDGLEATRVIRAMDRSDAKSIPIIALTANAFDEDVQRSMQAGLNAHLSKPVQPDTLYETLEELIWEYDMKE